MRGDRRRDPSAIDELTPQDLQIARLSERDLRTTTWPNGCSSEALEHESGLLGLAGTADMRELLAREDPDAQLALGVYVHRLRAGIAAMVASLGGLDALVFTGGVGERSARVRELACDGLAHLGVGTPGSSVRVLVVRAREDLEIARQARALLGVQGLEHL